MTADQLETAAWAETHEDFGRRLEQLLNMFESRKSAAQVAQKSVDQLQAYLKGRSSVPLLPVARLCRAKGVSLDWLATGQQPAAAAAPAGAPARGFQEVGGADPLDDGRMVQIPPYRSGAGMGRGSGRNGTPDAQGLTLPRSFVTRVLGRLPERLAVVSAVGDAMAPTVHEGDLLVVDTEDRRLSDGCLYVLQADGETLMRRTARRAGGGLQLLADHPGYADETVPADRIGGLSVVGRAVWLGCLR